MLTSKNWTAILLASTDKNQSVNFITTELRAEFCKNPNIEICNCLTCADIGNRKGLGFLWLSVNSSFDANSTNEILRALALQNSTDKNFFVVLENVEKMLRTSANRILKTLEEPPKGYKFIFTTQNASAVLDTIKSRCFVVNLNNLNGATPPPISAIAARLLEQPSKNMLENLYLIADKLEAEQSDIEQDFENLREIATREFLNNPQDPDRKIFLSKLLNVANNFVELSIAPGSGKLFWKAFIAQVIL